MFRVCRGVANKSFLASVRAFYANNLEGFNNSMNMIPKNSTAEMLSV
jgi:hypothetical protein